MTKWTKEQSGAARARGWDLVTIFDGKTTKPAYAAFDIALGVPSPALVNTLMSQAKNHDALALSALRLIYTKGK